MKLAIFKMKLNEHQNKISELLLALEVAEKERDQFLLESVGFTPGSTASLTGTISMIEKVIEMKAEA